MEDCKSVPIGSLVGQNEPSVSNSSHIQQDELIGDKNRIIRMALKRAGYDGIGKDREEDVRVLWTSLLLCLPPVSSVLSFLAYSAKMNATCSSETSVDFQRAARRYIPEVRTLHNHRCENLNSYIEGTCFLRSKVAYLYNHKVSYFGRQ
jgi:hypothetical protein